MLSASELKVAVEAEPCRCERCPNCQGTGLVRPQRYHDLGTCSRCRGTGGAALLCDRCDWLEEMSQEEHN